MSEATFEAETVEAALAKAAAELAIDVAELQHEVVEEKKDFWGTGGGTVVIKASARPAPVQETPEPVKEETAQPVVEETDTAVAEAAPADPAPGEPEAEPVEATASEAEQSASAVQTPEPATGAPQAAVADESARAEVRAVHPGGDGIEPEALSGLLAQIFHDMEFGCTIEVAAEDEGYLATIAGADKEALLEGNGRCLSALELIANNAFRHKLPRGHKIRVDAGDFRSRRDDELADLAFQVAHSAKQTGRTQETQPLNAYERRLVHLALAEDPAVSTLSRGSGFLKNVQIIPQGGGRGGGGGGRRS